MYYFGKHDGTKVLIVYNDLIVVDGWLLSEAVVIFLIVEVIISNVVGVWVHCYHGDRIEIRN